MTPMHVLVFTGILMGIAVFNSDYGIPFITPLAIFGALGFVIYTGFLAFSKRSTFLDAEFANEGRKTGETKTAFKLKYVLAFICWLPAVWFVLGMLLFNLPALL